jgi:protein-tyrosine phosphatase
MADDKPTAAPAPSDEAQRAAMRAATKRIDCVDNQLHVGGAISPAEYGRFSVLGITHVIDLREATEDDSNPARLQELGIERLQVPVPNHGAPRHDQLQEIAKWLEQCSVSPVTYVHCGGGFGRAATMAVALLVWRGVPLDQAMKQVRTARPEIRINDDQRAWLRAVEQARAPKS